MKFIPLNKDFGEHIPLDITEEQKVNLFKLADFLWALPIDYKHFDMGMFFGLDKNTDWDEVPADIRKYFDTPAGFDHTVYRHCGTAACAIGHGPKAGIPAIDDDNSWTSYATRVFGLHTDNNGCFLFGGDWNQYDQTAQGAALRIWYALFNGIPRPSMLDEYDEDENSSYIYYSYDEHRMFANFFNDFNPAYKPE